MIIIAVVALFLMPYNVQAERKIPVEIVHKGQDAIGSRLVYQLKEHIRRSEGLRLSSTNEPRLIIFLISKELSVENVRMEPASTFGFTLTWSRDGKSEYPIFFNSGIFVFESKRLNEHAESIVSDIDKTADFVRKVLELGEIKDRVLDSLPKP
jgi:hypothetical protein